MVNFKVHATKQPLGATQSSAEGTQTAPIHPKLDGGAILASYGYFVFTAKDGEAEPLLVVPTLRAVHATSRTVNHETQSLLQVQDGLLHVLARPLVAHEPHEPELEPVHGGDVDVLLLRPLHVLAGPHPADPLQRHDHLVGHPRRRVAVRRGDCDGAVAAERNLLGGHEEHAGDGAAGRIQVALQRLHQPLALLGGERLPEHAVDAAGPEDARAQAQLSLHGL
jgi:hypothetical protein